jgi:hypothetical protein
MSHSTINRFILTAPVGTNQKMRAYTDVLVTILVTKYEKNKKSPQKYIYIKDNILKCLEL